MKEKRRSYSKEFKQKALELSKVRGNVVELADVTMERDILKKAVGIFSASDRRSTNS